MGYDPFLGEIMLFAGNFPPYGYAVCDGSLMSISQNTALFSLLGTQYGGNGQTTFALPDLRGRVPMGAGAGPGLTPRYMGDLPGAESSPVPTADVVTDVAPATGEPALTVTKAKALTAPANITQQPVPTVQPSTVLNYCIATYGIYPSRW